MINNIIILFLIVGVIQYTSAGQVCGTATIYSSSSSCTGSNFIASTGCFSPNTCVQFVTSTGITFYQSSDGTNLFIYSDSACSSLLKSGLLGSCISYTYNSVAYSESTVITSGCVEIPQNFKCELQHDFKNGSCISIITETNSFKGTGDHLIYSQTGWKLIRELSVGEELATGKIMNITIDYCKRLNTCYDDGFQFKLAGETFSTMALITPDDLKRLPRWILKLVKLYANI